MSLNLRNPILATIIYYDIFDYPLTLPEVYKFLINPGRITRVNGGIGEININDILVELDSLIRSEVIGQKNGFYFIKGKEELYNLRIERNKIAERKWKKFLKLVRVLSLAPYLRGVFSSGSMAINNTDEKSDFDVLIIAKDGRLYTCRFFLWLISSLMGARRKKDEKVAPNKLCFNHYITDNHLHIPHESIFNAQTYINLKPAMISDGVSDEFYSANLWLSNYVYNFKPEKNFIRRNTDSRWLLMLLAGLMEVILDSFFGEWAEGVLKRYQQKLIADNPKTYESGGRVIFTDRELEFHPQSFEKIVVEKYKMGLRRFGVVSYIEENDSGLR